MWFRNCRLHICEKHVVEVSDVGLCTGLSGGPDPIDVWAVQLTEDECTRLGDLHFLKGTEVDDQGVTGRQMGLYAATGYPISKHRKRPPKGEPAKTSKRDLQVIGTTVRLDWMLDSRGVSRQHNVAVDFHREEMRGPQGRVMAPVPNGMSGGGLFWFPDRFDSNRKVLTAILTSWKNSDSVMVGTRLSGVISAIGDAWR